MTVHGLSNYIVERYDVNLNDYRVDMTLFLPRLSDKAFYAAIIDILGLKLDGKFRAAYVNTRAKIRFDFHKEIRNGTEFINIDNVLLTSDKNLSPLRSTHRVHNFYIAMMYPSLERSYGEIIREEINQLLYQVPFNVLLPE